MLFSFALLLLCGLLLGDLFKKIKFPPLFGFMLCGILLGPYCFKLIDASILDASASIRKVALIIILIRAGLNLDLDALKKVGRPAILMCFLPATFEIIGFALLGPVILKIKASTMIKIALVPAFNAYVGSTAAPTSSNNNISATIHN